MHQISILNPHLTCWIKQGCTGSASRLLAVSFAIVFAICDDVASQSAKTKETNPMKVLSYPPATEQREEVEHLSDAIRQMQPGEQDVMLRRMLECCSMGVAEELLAELRTSRRAPAELRKNASALVNRLLDIKELDEKSAPDFVSQAVAAKNPSTLCIALFALPTEVLQGSAAGGLRELRDPIAVRCLALRLRQVASVAQGGKEQQMIRIQLRKSLVAALSATTGMEMSDDGTEAAATKMLQATETWIATQKS